MASFKGLDHVLTILEVGQRLPCGIMKGVALPFHDILHTRAMVSFVQYGLHFILGFTMDDDGRWEVVRMSRRVEARGVGVGKKLAHIEDIMNLCRVELSRLECDGLEAVALILHEDSTEYGTPSWGCPPP